MRSTATMSSESLPERRSHPLWTGRQPCRCCFHQSPTALVLPHSEDVMIYIPKPLGPDELCGNTFCISVTRGSRQQRQTRTTTTKRGKTQAQRSRKQCGQHKLWQNKTFQQFVVVQWSNCFGCSRLLFFLLRCSRGSRVSCFCAISPCWRFFSAFWRSVEAPGNHGKIAPRCRNG